jgi:hypothetical protein
VSVYIPVELQRKIRAKFADCCALKMNRSQLVRVRKMWVKLGEHPPDIF